MIVESEAVYLGESEARREISEAVAGAETTLRTSSVAEKEEGGQQMGGSPL